MEIIYRDGNKSPETRFSSKTEQASEITMTPALYRCTIIQGRKKMLLDGGADLVVAKPT